MLKFPQLNLLDQYVLCVYLVKCNSITCKVYIFILNQLHHFDIYHIVFICSWLSWREAWKYSYFIILSKNTGVSTGTISHFEFRQAFCWPVHSAQPLTSVRLLPLLPWSDALFKPENCDKISWKLTAGFSVLLLMSIVIELLAAVSLIVMIKPWKLKVCVYWVRFSIAVGYI